VLASSRAVIANPLLNVWTAIRSATNRRQLGTCDRPYCVLQLVEKLGLAHLAGFNFESVVFDDQGN
jgi:hypothetical protein